MCRTAYQRSERVRRYTLSQENSGKCLCQMARVRGGGQYVRPRVGGLRQPPEGMKAPNYRPLSRASTARGQGDDLGLRHRGVSRVRDRRVAGAAGYTRTNSSIVRPNHPVTQSHHITHHHTIPPPLAPPPQSPTRTLPTLTNTNKRERPPDHRKYAPRPPR